MTREEIVDKATELIKNDLEHQLKKVCRASKSGAIPDEGDTSEVRALVSAIYLDSAEQMRPRLLAKPHRWNRTRRNYQRCL